MWLQLVKENFVPGTPRDTMEIFLFPHKTTTSSPPSKKKVELIAVGFSSPSPPLKKILSKSLFLLECSFGWRRLFFPLKRPTREELDKKKKDRSESQRGKMVQSTLVVIALSVLA